MTIHDIEYIQDNLQKEDLSEWQQVLYDFLGAEKYVELCRQFGGISTFSVNTIKTLEMTIKKRKIRADLDLYRSGDMSIKEIAIIHNVSQSTVYNMLAEENK